MNTLPLGIHTWFMVIPFGLLLPLGIVVSRWRDPEPPWLRKLGTKQIRNKWLDMHVILKCHFSHIYFFFIYNRVILFRHSHLQNASILGGYFGLFSYPPTLERLVSRQKKIES